MTILYGIKNCDTVKKARAWLNKRGIEYQFHDFRADGLSRLQVEQWLELGADKLVNKRSRTWNQLTEQDKLALNRGAPDIILANPTLIKRPLLWRESLNGSTTEPRLHIGFDESEYAKIFA